MESLMNMIIGTSETFDVYVLIRLILVLVAAEMAVGIATGIGGLNK